MISYDVANIDKKGRNFNQFALFFYFERSIYYVWCFTKKQQKVTK